MTVVNGIDAIFFTSSGSHEQNFMTQRSLAMRESIVRLKCKRALKQRQSLQRRFRHSCIRERCRAQDEIVGVEIIWTFALGPFDLCLAQISGSIAATVLMVISSCTAKISSIARS